MICHIFKLALIISSAISHDYYLKMKTTNNEMK